MNALPIIGIFIISMLPNNSRDIIMLEPMEQIESRFLLDILGRCPDNSTMIVKDITAWPGYARMDSFFANYLLSSDIVAEIDHLDGYFKSIDDGFLGDLMVMRHRKKWDKK